jgi:hypothetical protein
MLFEMGLQCERVSLNGAGTCYTSRNAERMTHTFKEKPLCLVAEAWRFYGTERWTHRHDTQTHTNCFLSYLISVMCINGAIILQDIELFIFSSRLL